MQDEELLNLLRSSPNHGLKQLVRQYSGLVLTIIKGALSEVCDSSEIEDCVADVFINFYNSLPAYKADASIKTYLGVIARNTASSCLRKHHRSIYIGEENYIEIPDLENTEESAIKNAFLSSLIAAVRKLGPPDSEIIFRKYYLGHNSKTIAEALKMSVANVDTRSSRAIAKLRQSLNI